MYFVWWFYGDAFRIEAEDMYGNITLHNAYYLGDENLDIDWGKQSDVH